MTRLKYNEHGSYLVVVSSSNYLRKFGKEISLIHRNIGRQIISKFMKD